MNEIAVLYRAHYHSMEVQMELTRHGIPFQITSGVRFFEQAHIKDVAAFLKFVVNPSDEVAFKRMARLLPGIGARSAEQLWNGFLKREQRPPGQELEAGSGERPPYSYSENLLPLKVPAKARKGWEQLAHTIGEIAPDGKPKPPEEMLSVVIEAVYDDYLKENFSNYDQRREDLNVLENYARQYESAHEFLDQLALLSSLETEAELCLLYTSPSPRDGLLSRMPSSA